MFSDMMQQIRHETLKKLSHLELSTNSIDDLLRYFQSIDQEFADIVSEDYKNSTLPEDDESIDPSAELISNDADAAEVQPTGMEPSRNEPCPCGSGKRYKHCHGS
jgi:preprotein translocase subunit SecA